jgi:hypothetical protein
MGKRIRRIVVGVALSGGTHDGYTFNGVLDGGNLTITTNPPV